MKSELWWILDANRVPVRVHDLIEWARWYENTNRRVAETTIGDASVSTVFLGINHSFDRDAPPLLFETMVFGGEHDRWQDRASTWKQAEEMHERACAMVRGGK